MSIARSVVASAVAEKDLSQAIVDAARVLGWRAYRTHDSRRSPEGFPDLVLVKPPRVIFAELKRESGKVSPAQADWLAALGLCRGVETWLVRPSNLDLFLDALAGRPAP